MENIIIPSWLGPPDTTLVSENGLKLECHRVLLGLKHPQFRPFLDLSHDNATLLLGGIDNYELTEFFKIIYKLDGSRWCQAEDELT